jgi:hypothetical protein
MQMDPTSLAFTFAKELALQLITLSTGLLALTVTFTKEILKTVTKRNKSVLRIASIILFLSILCGVWTLMALTGTLMPVTPVAHGTPYQFGPNVRWPAAAQVILFCIGTILLVILHAAGDGKAAKNEFKFVAEQPDKLAAELERLKLDGWDAISFSIADPTQIVALLKRTSP